DVKRRIPLIDISPNKRYPILGASFQPRGGVARHDAVAWGFARGASKLGVDIVENCEVTGLDIGDGRIKGLTTSRGYIGAERVGCVAAGHSSVLARMAGIRMPIERHPLQAVVSEPMQAALDTVVL